LQAFFVFFYLLELSHRADKPSKTAGIIAVTQSQFE